MEYEFGIGGKKAASYSRKQSEVPASTSSTAARLFGTRPLSSFELGTLLRQQWTLFMIQMGITKQSHSLSTKRDESKIEFYIDSFIDFLEDCLIEFFEE